jgi:hypothetical protein
MKKIIGYIILFFCIIIYIVSSSERLTKKIVMVKNKDFPLLRSDKMRYGDLFGLSYLSDYKISIDEKSSIELTQYKKRGSVNLYSLCDSYLWSLLTSDSLFCANKFQYANLNNFETLNVKFDTPQKNILLIELSERNIILMVQQNYSYMLEFIKTQNEQNYASSSISHHVSEFLFNKNINNNIEFNLWESEVFTPIKEFKAQLSYKLFNEVNKDAVISPDKKYLLYSPTVDTSSIYSSFKNISDTEIDTIINNLNNIYSHYKNLGFTEVYFSLIPNPVTILYPNLYKRYSYNQLIPRIQNSSSLKMPFIDIYSDFKKTQVPIYRVSDTHWNRNGFNLWLNKVNEVLSGY